jgi:predicted RNA binding protein YcfA (HicA-like mRNA interferase family)
MNSGMKLNPSYILNYLIRKVNQMKPMPVKQAEKYLKQSGYEPIRRESSHVVYSNGIQVLPSLPVHGKEVSAGVWRNILKAISGK